MGGNEINKQAVREIFNENLPMSKDLNEPLSLSTEPKDFPGVSDGTVSAYKVGDLGSIPGLGGCPGEGNGNPLQYSCLENTMDGGNS